MRLFRSLVVAVSFAGIACATGAQEGDTSSSSDPLVFCNGYCKKLVGCDNARDEQTCQNTCKNQNAAIFPKLRVDVLSKVSSCIDQRDCKTVLSSDVIAKCSDEAVASVAPTETAKKFCDQLAATQTKCGGSAEKTQCLNRAKLYNDKALTDASMCTTKACADITKCVDAALGSLTTQPSTSSPKDGDAGTNTGPMCSAIGAGRFFDFDTA